MDPDHQNAFEKLTVGERTTLAEFAKARHELAEAQRDLERHKREVERDSQRVTDAQKAYDKAKADLGEKVLSVNPGP